MSFSKENSVLWLKVWAIFSKFLIKQPCVYRFHYRNPKLKLELQSQKTIYLLITMEISLNIQTYKFVYRFTLETTILASFPSKSLSRTVISSHSQKLSTLNIAKFTTSTKTDITLQTSVKLLRAITMCTTFTPDWRYDTSIIKLIANVYCPNTMCSGILYVHRKTFQSLGRSDCQCPQRTSTCQMREIPFDERTNSFFLRFGQGIYIFEETHFWGDGTHCVARKASRDYEKEKPYQLLKKVLHQSQSSTP